MSLMVSTMRDNYFSGGYSLPVPCCERKEETEEEEDVDVKL